MDDLEVDRKSYDFVFLFNKTTGSPKVQYFMLDPRRHMTLFPRGNTITFSRLKNLVHFKPVVLDNRLYIIGGKDWETGVSKATTWRYDPHTSHWSPCANMNVARCRHTADVVNGCIYVTGGESHESVTDSCEVYDPLTDKWSLASPLPRPRADHASCVCHGGLYISGGISNLKQQCSNLFCKFDHVTGNWEEPLPGVILPHDREKHQMVAYGRKIFVITGRGFDQDTWKEKDEAAICSYNTRLERGEERTRQDQAWDVYHPNLMCPRSSAGVVLVGHYIYIMGGKSYAKDAAVRVVECYNARKRKIRSSFMLPDSFDYMSVDCVKLQVPVHNVDINFNDLLLYNKWIMW